MTKDPIVNPKRAEELKDILEKVGKVSNLTTGRVYTQEEMKEIEENFKELDKGMQELEEIPGIWTSMKDYAGKIIKNKKTKGQIKEVKKADKFRDSKGVPTDNYTALRLVYQEQHRQKIKSRNRKIEAGVLVPLTVAGLAQLWQIHKPDTPPPELNELTTYLKINDDGTGELVDIGGTSIPLNLSAANLKKVFEGVDGRAVSYIDTFMGWEGGIDKSVSDVTFDAQGNVDFFIKGLNTNNSVMASMDYQTALERFPNIIDNVDRMEIRTKAYTEPGTDPVYRTVAGDEIVNKTVQLLGLDIDPTKYFMNVTSDFDHTTKTAKHGVKFVATDDSVADIDITDLTKEVMAQVNDIVIDNIAGDDYTSMLETISVWEGVHQTLAPIVNYYTDLVIRLTDERDQNNSALNGLSAHCMHILENVSKLGYINMLNYSTTEEAVANITDRVSELLKRDLIIEDKKMFRFVYESLPEQYKQFMVKEGADLDVLLDGSTDNGEFERFNASISGKLTEIDANGNEVNATGQSLFDATGTEHDYNPKDVPREAIEMMAVYKLIGEGVFSAEPKERIIDRDTANMLYIGLGNIDQANAENGIITQYQKQLMEQHEYERLFNAPGGNDTDGELGNITIRWYTAPNAGVDIDLEEILPDGTKAYIPKNRNTEFLEAVYQVIGDGE